MREIFDPDDWEQIDRIQQMSRSEEAPALFFVAMLFDFLLENGDPSTFAARTGVSAVVTDLQALFARLDGDPRAQARLDELLDPNGRVTDAARTKTPSELLADLLGDE